MTEQQLIDRKARVVFSENVQRRLMELGENPHWLMLQTGDTTNRFYPAIRGETNLSAGFIARVAAILRMKVDELIPVTEIVPKRMLTPPTPSKKKLARNLQKSA